MCYHGNKSFAVIILILFLEFYLFLRANSGDGVGCNMTQYKTATGNRLLAASGAQIASQQATDLRQQLNPVFQVINELSKTLENNYGINPDTLKNMNLTVLQNFYNNIKFSSAQLSNTFSVNLDIYINPDYTNPNLNTPNLVTIVSNQNKLAYAFAQLGGTSPPVLKQVGLVSSNTASSTVTVLIPQVVSTKLFPGGTSITLSVQVVSPGRVFGIAVFPNATKPSSLQIYLGIDGNNVNATAMDNGSTNYDSSGNLAPIRLNFMGLKSSINYTIYYVPAYDVPNSPIFSPIVLSISGYPAIGGNRLLNTLTMSSIIDFKGKFTYSSFLTYF